jgi:hypothetical protein
MTPDNPNRYRVSSKMTILKIGLFIGLFAVVFNIVRELTDNSFSVNIFPFLFAGIVLAVIYFYINNLKQIDYDDIKQTLYVVDSKAQTEIEVPVEKIDKIYLSAFGGRGNSSYVIVYRDFHNQQQKVRLFPILFDDSIKTIKTDTELKNPNVVIRNWSFGWNEIF